MLFSGTYVLISDLINATSLNEVGMAPMKSNKHQSKVKQHKEEHFKIKYIDCQHECPDIRPSQTGIQNYRWRGEVIT